MLDWYLTKRAIWFWSMDCPTNPGHLYNDSRSVYEHLIDLYAWGAWNVQYPKRWNRLEDKCFNHIFFAFQFIYNFLHELCLWNNRQKAYIISKFRNNFSCILCTSIYSTKLFLANCCKMHDWCYNVCSIVSSSCTWLHLKIIERKSNSFTLSCKCTWRYIHNGSGFQLY